MMQKLKGNLWKKQEEALRDPNELFTGSFKNGGLVEQSLEYTADDAFIALLEKLKITLFVTREYEHLVLAFSANKNSLRQSFLHLAHPSGLVVDREKNTIYIVATRNPNQVWELKPVNGFLDRIDWLKNEESDTLYMVPVRTKYFPGAYYLHDLAIINKKLYANSVGQNAIVHIDFNSSLYPDPIWWPKCVSKNGKLNRTANFIQLNSIAAGESIEKSFFSASSNAIEKVRPGDSNYSVDKQGVIFSGKTRDVIAKGLTRPHSARLYKNKIWIDNSGYGEFGFIENKKLQIVRKLPGWTRGLMVKDNIAFVGVSRVLPKFKQYAPGLSKTNYTCGIYAVDLKSGNILGKILFPYGNQVFSIDWINSSVTQGFIFDTIAQSNNRIKGFFYKYIV